MRDIEGIEKAVAIMQPHWNEIDEVFQEANERFKRLMNADHDHIGRVLKSHLVLERYMDDYLRAHYGLSTLDDARLSFFEKATLLPNEASPAAFVKPGILKVNSLRNQLAHDLEMVLDVGRLGPINTVLDVARPNATLESPIARIEAFAAVGCAFLLVTPPSLREIFLEAFAEVRVNVIDN